MTEHAPVEDGGPPTLEDIRQSAKVLRRALLVLRAGGTGNISVQDLADYAVVQLHSCIFQGWTPPDQLILLLGELLDDPNRKQPRGLHNPPAPPLRHHGECSVCGPGPDTSVEEDRLELHRVHDAIRPHVEAAIVGVNVVGIAGFNAAAEFEAGHPPDSDDQAPSSVSIASIAKAAKASRSSVKRWREMNSYRYLVDRLRRRK